MAGISIGSSSISKIYVGTSEVQKIFYGATEVYSSASQLAAPTISLSSNDLIINEVANAQDYDIYVDGVKKDTVHHERMIGTITNTGTQVLSVYIDDSTIAVQPSSSVQVDPLGNVEIGWSNIGSIDSYSGCTYTGPIGSVKRLTITPSQQNWTFNMGYTLGGHDCTIKCSPGSSSKLKILKIDDVEYHPAYELSAGSTFAVYYVDSVTLIPENNNGAIISTLNCTYTGDAANGFVVTATGNAYFEYRSDASAGYLGTITNSGYMDLNVVAIDTVQSSEVINAHDSKQFVVAQDMVIIPAWGQGYVVSYSGCTYTGDETSGIIITPTAQNWTFDYFSED